MELSAHEPPTAWAVVAGATMSATGWSAMDRQAWGGSHVTPYKPRSGSIVVLADASYGDGRAAIAYVAPFGSGAEVIDAENSGMAEDAALILAMHAVYRYAASCRDCRIPKTDFLTDCNPPLRRRPDPIRRYLASYKQWKLVPVPRTQVHDAHSLARSTMRKARREPAA